MTIKQLAKKYNVISKSDITFLIHDLRNRGVPAPLIAEELDMTLLEVISTCPVVKEKVRRRGRISKETMQKVLVDVRDLYKSGATVDEISKACNISDNRTKAYLGLHKPTTKTLQTLLKSMQ